MAKICAPLCRSCRCSYELVTIKTDVDLSSELPNGMDDLRRSAPKWAQLAVHFRELGFKTWLKEAENQFI